MGVVLKVQSFQRLSRFYDTVVIAPLLLCAFRLAPARRLAPPEQAGTVPEYALMRTSRTLTFSFSLAPSIVINPVQDPRPEALVCKRRHQRTKMLHQRPTVGLIFQNLTR